MQKKLSEKERKFSVLTTFVHSSRVPLYLCWDAE